MMNRYERMLAQDEATSKEKSGMAKSLLAPAAGATGWLVKDHFTTKGNSKAAAAALIAGALAGGALGIAGAKDSRASEDAKKRLNDDQRLKNYNRMLSYHDRKNS